jgi:hypothetical protein
MGSSEFAVVATDEREFNLFSIKRDEASRDGYTDTIPLAPVLYIRDRTKTRTFEDIVALTIDQGCWSFMDWHLAEGIQKTDSYGTFEAFQQ